MYRILVPLDGSRFAEQALSTACALARRAGGELKLAHVVDFVSFLPDPQDSAEESLHQNARNDAEHYLEHQRAELEQTSGVPVNATVTEGLPADEIQEQAKKWRADLIVMATHGHGAFDRAWIGSVADAVVRASSTPVVLVRADESQAAKPGAQSLANILIALDGSNLAEQAVEPVVRLARAIGGRLIVLRVVRPWVVATRPMAYAHQLPELREKALAARCAEARDYVTRIASSLEGDLENVTSDVIVAESSEAAEIIRYADRCEVDLIALATRGRSGLRRLMLGSVADKLIRGSRVPVLVVRPHD